MHQFSSRYETDTFLDQYLTPSLDVSHDYNLVILPMMRDVHVIYRRLLSARLVNDQISNPRRRSWHIGKVGIYHVC